MHWSVNGKLSVWFHSQISEAMCVVAGWDGAMNGEGALVKLRLQAGQAPGGIRARRRRAFVWGRLEAERGEEGEAEPKQRVL